MESKGHLEEKREMVGDDIKEFIKKEYNGVIQLVGKNHIFFSDGGNKPQCIFKEDLFKAMNNKSMSIIEEADEDADEELPNCVFCKKECENKWGNNAHPMKDDGVACNDCNQNKVIPGRLLITQIERIMAQVKEREKKAKNKSMEAQHRAYQKNSIQVQEEVLPLLQKLKQYQ